LTEIGFTDPTNGDFSIASASPITTAGIGDPRWISSANSIEGNAADSKEVKSVI